MRLSQVNETNFALAIQVPLSFYFHQAFGLFSLNHCMICSDFELSHHSNTSAVPVESKPLSIEAFG